MGRAGQAPDPHRACEVLIRWVVKAAYYLTVIALFRVPQVLPSPTRDGVVPARPSPFLHCWPFVLGLSVCLSRQSGLWVPWVVLSGVVHNFLSSGVVPHLSIIKTVLVLLLSMGLWYRYKCGTQI